MSNPRTTEGHKEAVGLFGKTVCLAKAKIGGGGRGGVRRGASAQVSGGASVGCKEGVNRCISAAWRKKSAEEAGRMGEGTVMGMAGAADCEH